MTSRAQISRPALENPSKLRSPRRNNRPRALQRLELEPRCRPTSATKVLRKSAWKKFSAPEPARRPHRQRPRPKPPKSSIRRTSCQPSAFSFQGSARPGARVYSCRRETQISGALAPEGSGPREARVNFCKMIKESSSIMATTGTPEPNDNKQPNISAAKVKELRDLTGAPMMDCKKALTEANGDAEKAVVILRKRGAAVAQKKATRITSEGSVAQYIHAGGKIGVLVEVNCESDFVARTDDFKRLINEIAMHIAASDPKFIRKEDVTAADYEREKDIYRAQTAAMGKP